MLDIVVKYITDVFFEVRCKSKIIAYGFSFVKGGVPGCSGAEKVAGKICLHVKMFLILYALNKEPNSGNRIICIFLAGVRPS